MTAARLLVDPDDADPRSVVQFTCEQCGRAVSQRVGERATRLLSAAGIELVAPTPAAEPVRSEGDIA
jgi:hypothetical protein